MFRRLSSSSLEGGSGRSCRLRLHACFGCTRGRRHRFHQTYIFNSKDHVTSGFPLVSDSLCLTNHLTLNLAKTKEIVFKRPRARRFHLPPAIDNIEQLDCNKLLGVLFQSNFKMDMHVQNILIQCTQPLTRVITTARVVSTGACEQNTHVDGRCFEKALSCTAFFANTAHEHGWSVYGPCSRAWFWTDREDGWCVPTLNIWNNIIY